MSSDNDQKFSVEHWNIINKIVNVRVSGTHNREEALSVAAEHVCRYLSAYDSSRCSFDGFIAKMAVYGVLTWKRDRVKVREYSTSYFEPESFDPEIVEPHPDLPLHRLSSRQRFIVERTLEGRFMREIAVELGVTKGAVFFHKRNAIRILRRYCHETRQNPRAI